MYKRVTFLWSLNYNADDLDGGYVKNHLSFVTTEGYTLGDWLAEDQVKFFKAGNEYIVLNAFGKLTGERYKVIDEESAMKIKLKGVIKKWNRTTTS